MLRGAERGRCPLRPCGAALLEARGSQDCTFERARLLRMGKLCSFFLSRSPDRKHDSLRFVRKRGEGERRPPERGWSEPFSGCRLPAPPSPPALGAERRPAPGRHAGSLLTLFPQRSQRGAATSAGFPYTKSHCPSPDCAGPAPPQAAAGIPQQPLPAIDAPERRRPPPLPAAPTHLL